MLHASSRSDIARLAEVARFTGAAQDRDAGAELLALTNRIWRTNTIAARFISDSMVATWLASPVLWPDIPELLAEEHQYRLLAWYCCARPFATGCQLSREPVDVILDRMAREIVAESPFRRLPYTALMMSVYHFRPDVRDAVSLKGEARRPTFLGWYYSHGVRELAILHHVSEEERATLNAIADEQGYDILSPLCLLALDWLAHPYFDLTSREGRVRAWGWFTDTAVKSEPLAALFSGGDTRSDGAGHAGTRATGDDLDATPRGEAARPGTVIAAAFGDPDQTIDRAAKYRVERQVAEYFDRRGAGLRLLFDGEWFPGEDTFCWSHAPWASLIFQLAGSADDALNIGILLHPTGDAAVLPDRRLALYFNGHLLWEGLLRDATDGELVLRAAGWQAGPAGLNLLQFHTSEPFIPSETSASTDSRHLGVALRRFWVAPGNRRPGEVTGMRQPRRPRLGRPLPDSRMLLVLRGDLRSHTGYAKATRALAKLVPLEFRTIGVDIHPDPADNQAAVSFPVVPEGEALEQVVEHPSRCVVVHCTAPDDFAVWPNARNVGWFFWETDAIPHLREWPLRLGLMDAIWAPTTFMAEFCRSAGYGGPIHPIAWPDEFAGVPRSSDVTGEAVAYFFDEAVDAWRLRRPRPLNEVRGRARLLFLAVQSLAPRKGLPLLLSEWRSHVERSGGSDVLLLRIAFRHAAGISTGWHEVFQDALATAGFERSGPLRIAVIPTAISEEALTALYRVCDALVSMSYGEGFGGPVLEAMRNGRAVIAPRHTGLRDLLPANYPFAIASTRLAVALRGNLAAYPHSATWYVPDAGELCSKIEAFAAMSPRTRRTLVEECAKHAMSFCWAPVVRQKLAAALADLRLDAPGPRRDRGPAGSLNVHTSRHAAD